MSEERSYSLNIGGGLSGLVFVAFLVLKLAEIGAVANWSWWWVASPLWIPLLFWVAMVVVLGAVALVAAVFE